MSLIQAGELPDLAHEGDPIGPGGGPVAGWGRPNHGLMIRVTVLSLRYAVEISENSREKRSGSREKRIPDPASKGRGCKGQTGL